MATLTARADLLVGDRTVRDARAVTLAAAAAWRCDVSTESLLLLVDELAAAVRERADTEHTLLLMLSAHDGQGLRVTLADGGAVRATAARVVEGTPVLAGLLESLATRWDHEPYRDGYGIWFELGPEDPEPPAAPSGRDELDVDLAIELDLQRRRGAAPASQPSVDGVTAARLDAWLGADH